MDCNQRHVLDLPQVGDTAQFVLYHAGLSTADGHDVGAAFSAFPGLLILRPEDDAFGTRVQRTKILGGRRALRPDEVLVGVEVAERFGMNLGDRPAGPAHHDRGGGGGLGRTLVEVCFAGAVTSPISSPLWRFET